MITDLIKCKDVTEMPARSFNMQDFCKYTGLGQAQARQLVVAPDCAFSYRIGRRWFVDRVLFDKWLDEQLEKRDN